MHTEISSSVKLISKELRERTENNSSRGRFELIELLKTLNPTEKYLIANYFSKLPWNIGSLRVLAVLHDQRILTATEYILSCDNTDDVQLILNDFLETELDLITNLFINSTFDTVYSVRLNEILDDCVENLFKDLIENPELNDLGFLRHVRNQLPVEILQKIISKHLGVVLRLHQSTGAVAFGQLSKWINEGVDDMKFPRELCEHLLTNNIEDSLHYLLKVSSEENFKDWKYFIILLQTISSVYKEKAGPFVRKYLQMRLKQCASVPCKQSMMQILLIARASNAVTMDFAKNLDHYADWYKNNIGEMKIFLKADEFQNVLSLLDQCLKYEMEIDYLEIHAAISISPPILCGKLVQAYKSKCKLRLQQIKKGHIEPLNINESIIIEDSN